jgi:hypothetical protein
MGLSKYSIDIMGHDKYLRDKCYKREPVKIYVLKNRILLICANWG